MSGDRKHAVFQHYYSRFPDRDVVKPFKNIFTAKALKCILFL